MLLFALLLIQCVFAQDVEPTKTGPCTLDITATGCNWYYYDHNKTLIVRGRAGACDHLKTEENDCVGWKEVKPDIETVIIEEGFTSLSRAAFKNSPKLKKVSLPNSLTELDPEVFTNCPLLTEVNIPNSIKWILESTFEDCSSLEQIEIPEKCTAIDANAFSGCTSLKKFNIPASLNEIAYSAFSHCSSLETIEIDEANEQFTLHRGSLFSKDKTELLRYLSGSESQFYVVPENTQMIAPYAFSGSLNLETLRIPPTTKSIAQTSFLNCSSLSKVEVPTRNDIPYCTSAFDELDKLDNITLQQGSGEGATYCGKKAAGDFIRPFDCGDYTEGSKVNYYGCFCIENAVRVSDTACKCAEGYEKPDYRSTCEKRITCGKYTKQQGIEKNYDECTCVPNAVLVEGENRCECPEGYYGDEEGKTCSKIIKCGPLTEQETNDNNTIPCSCKSHAHFYGETACVCDNGYVEVDGVCKQLLYCSSFTNEKDKPEKTTECTCVQNATKLYDNICQCDEGLYSDYVENKCKKLITCGELTNQYKNTRNDEECTCVDLAQFNENNTCECVEHAKPVEGQNKCECEDRYEQSGKYYCMKKATTHTCGSQCIWKSGPYNSWVVVSGFGSISDGVEIVELGESLTSIRIVDGIETIESNVFKGLTQLETISIPASVSKIGDHAFGDCKKVNKIEFLGRSSPKTCAANAFSVSVKVSVPSDYYDDSFCGLPIEKTETPSTPSTPENCPTDGSSNIMILFLIVLLTLLF